MDEAWVSTPTIEKAVQETKSLWNLAKTSPVAKEVLSTFIGVVYVNEKGRAFCQWPADLLAGRVL
jgi:hypothetical protein